MQKLVLVFLTMMVSMSAHSQSKMGELLLSLSDAELFKAGLNNKVGSCYIADSRGNGNFCDYYAQTRKPGLQGIGLPHGLGSGCLVAPYEPKGVGNCWSSPNVYDQYNDSATPICTNDFIKNGANMLRIAIKRGICDLDQVVPTPTPIVTPTPVSTPVVVVTPSPLQCDQKKNLALIEELNKSKIQLDVLARNLQVCGNEKAKQIDNGKKQLEENKKAQEELKKIIVQLKKEIEEGKKKAEEAKKLGEEHKKKFELADKNEKDRTRERDQFKKAADDCKKNLSQATKERDQFKKASEDSVKNFVAVSQERDGLKKQVNDLKKKK
ncbi:MAG: hypothetical protein ACOYL6_15790 [Bacteriovoracaceae bacterium]